MKKPFLLVGAILTLSTATMWGASVKTLPLEACRLQSAIARGAAEARCGWFDVAENRDAANSRRLRIHIAVIPALRRQALPDPVFVISGGPGQAASDFYLSSSRAFDDLRRDRDIVVIDQRGTGKSNRLDCKLPDELESARFDAELIKSYTRECLTKLAGDPRFYSTSVAVRDLDEIRAALGYDKINLYGISYGTRVVQHYVRRYATHVRAIVLDGIVPVDVVLGPEVAPAAQSALDAILKRCERSAECRQAFPTIADDLQQLQVRLAKQAVPLTIAHPSTAIPTQIEFGPMHLAISLRLHSYSDDTASLVPFLIHEAANHRPQAMAAHALMVSRDLSEQIANGMHNAVVCTEDAPFFTSEALSNPDIARSYLGRVFVDSLLAMCSVWPRGAIDDDFHAPLRSAVPALLLSGENDPVTPASYGERAAQNFAGAEHVIVPGQGHGQLNNPCLARVLTRFIEQAAAKNIDVSCVAKQAAAPFMLSAATPGP